jgi:hypothetical protein
MNTETRADARDAETHGSLREAAWLLTDASARSVESVTPFV